MKLLFGLVVALASLAGGHAVRAKLARADRAHPGRLSGRHRAGRRGARDRRQDGAEPRQAGGDREHFRRERQHRLRQGREVRAGRLHAGDVRQRLADRRAGALRQDPVRSGEGLRADQPDLRREQYPGRASRRAGENAGRTGRAGEGEARRTHLRPRRCRHVAASRRRAVQGDGEGGHPPDRLSRHDRDRPGSARRTHLDRVQQHRQHDAAGEGRTGCAPSRCRRASARRWCPSCRPWPSPDFPDTRRCRGSA